jgi:hypothetical protein
VISVSGNLSFRLLACLILTSFSRAQSAGNPVRPIENVYADVNDAYGAMGAIDSGLANRYAGKDRGEWEQIYKAKRKELVTGLKKGPYKGLSKEDERAVTVMRQSLKDLPETSATSAQPSGKCKESSRKHLSYAELRGALYSCFDEVGSNLRFEGKTVARLSVFDLLVQIKEPERRRAAFLALTPLWQAINGGDQRESPYRRVMGMAARNAKKHGSAVDDAARTVGVSSSEVESWLEQILDAWRGVNGDQPIEPWDYWYRAGETDRQLESAIPREALQSLNERYYHDLGADLKQLGILYDLDPRPGKAPIAYAEFVTHGRMVDAVWHRSVMRVSANYAGGGLGALNEFVHENGHAIHGAAIQSRPAFMDMGDALFVEAFADVTSWSVYEPAWQRRYLGQEAPEAATIRCLFSNVMMDVAWALFEIRMLGQPGADPNVVWTEITNRYLHIVPHPEWSWWAVRAQMVDAPGYMVNYGLGAVLTADLREHVRESFGPFDAGNAGWYGWISESLLRQGEERPTAEQLQEFLGRPISPEALLRQIGRIKESGKEKVTAEPVPKVTWATLIAD